MTWSDVASVLTALAFVAVMVCVAFVLVRIAGVFTEMRTQLRASGEKLPPVIEEAGKTVSGVNHQIARVDTITSNISDITGNSSALVSLFASTVGGPLIKVAGFTAGVRASVGALRKPRQPRGSAPRPSKPSKPAK